MTAIVNLPLGLPPSSMSRESRPGPASAWASDDDAVAGARAGAVVEAGVAAAGAEGAACRRLCWRQARWKQALSQKYEPSTMPRFRQSGQRLVAGVVASHPGAAHFLDAIDPSTHAPLLCVLCFGGG